MGELTHIKQILPAVLKKAVKKQGECGHSDKMTDANRRRIDEFLGRIGREMPTKEYI